jgi:hypothetical protein
MGREPGCERGDRREEGQGVERRDPVGVAERFGERV